MAIYTIEINYTATYTAIVEADDESEAFDRARTEAEEADIRDFMLSNEQPASIVHVAEDEEVTAPW